MPRFLLLAAAFSHLLPGKDSLSQSDSDPDAEKEGSDGLGGAPKAGNDDVLGDNDQENVYASDDEQDGPGFTEGEGEEDEPSPTQRRGVRLVATSTVSSTTTLGGIVRPSLPRCLVKIKEVLFGTPIHPDEAEVSAPHYRLTPILAGCIIPFSILLQIPGLTEHWYVRTSGNETVEARSNSPLLEASLVLSMVLVVFANLALICRFLERRVKRCTILCIVALTLHDILNVVTVITFGVRHRFDDGFTYGEAYWMTICSTVVSMITNVTLIWDLIKTPNFSKSGSGITRRQRSLVIITMIFLSYVALGALISSLMMSLTFLNGLFFTIVTTLTIGFGDIVPVTPTQRFVVCFYAVFGIIILGAGVRLTTEAVLEGIEVGYRRRMQGYRKRRMERKRQRHQVRRWRAAVEERLVERGLEVWTPDKPPSDPNKFVRPNVRHQGSNALIRGSNFLTQPMRLNTEALSPEALESAAQEAGVPLEDFIDRKFRRRARHHHHHHHHLNQDQIDQRQQQQQQPQQQPQQQSERSGRVPLEFTWTLDDAAIHELEHEPHKARWCGGAWWKRVCRALRRGKSSDGEPSTDAEPEPSPDLSSTNTMGSMLKVAEREERRSLYIKLGLSWSLFFTFWTIGSLIFSQTEGWTYGQSMYFCFIAFTTIGYGDFAPETALGRSIFVFWALFGVGTMTVLIAVLSDAFSSKYRHVTHKKKTFDRAVSRYREGQAKSSRREIGEKCAMVGDRPLSEILQANLAKITAIQQACPLSPLAQPGLTLAEADACLPMVLKEVMKFREHTRYFFIASGHADVLSMPADPRGKSGISFPHENEVPEELKKLVDEIAQAEGFDERLKQEVWDDDHARNVSLSLQGARRLIEAAELAMEMLARRDQLAVVPEQDVGTEGVSKD
ncbi:hypothetical protein EI94DRAFT_1727948 [Lactarius quietus]|nr:hypothetical protein EI94DRAFT_1727948 [Lactarius quietus]